MTVREVLIDVTRLLGRTWKGRLPTGVDRVGLAYIERYGARARAVVRLAGRSFVLPTRASESLFRWLLKPGRRREAALAIAGGLLTGWRDQQVAGQILFNTGHSGLELDGYPHMLKRMRVRPVFVVHDLIPVTHPEYCRAGERERHTARMKNALALANGVIANSQATLDELGAFADRAGRPLPLAVVGSLAPGMSGVTPAGRPMPQAYFVMLSTIEPRKNHWLLLQVWRSLAERFGDSAPRLVVIGQRGWECENVVDLLERCEELKGRVFEHSNCTDAELVTYLSHAQALLFPSFAEGYGMPLVEALALGVPAIVSDLPAFREIAGDIPEYVDPLDGMRWRELVTEYAKPDSPLRLGQLSRMERFETPNWSGHFAAVDALLRKLNEQNDHA